MLVACLVQRLPECFKEVRKKLFKTKKDHHKCSKNTYLQSSKVYKLMSHIAMVKLMPIKISLNWCIIIFYKYFVTKITVKSKKIFDL